MPPGSNLKMPEGSRLFFWVSRSRLSNTQAGLRTQQITRDAGHSRDVRESLAVQSRLVSITSLSGWISA